MLFSESYKNYSTFLFSTLLLLPSLSLAELSFCNGVWTNQACNEEETDESLKDSAEESSPEGSSEGSSQGSSQGSSLPETQHQPRLESEIISDKKKSLIHDITMKRIEARRKYGVLFSSDITQSSCENKATSLEECQNNVNDYLDRLQANIDSHLKQRELESSIESKEASGVSEEKSINSNSTAIYIYNRGEKEVIKPTTPPTLEKVQVKKENSAIRLKGSSKGKNINVELEGQSISKEVRKERRLLKGKAIKVSPLSTSNN